MAKNFTIVNGTNPKSGQPIVLTLTTKEIDVLDEFFDIRPMPGVVYKEERQVTRVFSPRGVLANNVQYRHYISYIDDSTPRINYSDTKTGLGYQVSSTEFCEWLGKSWEAVDVKESPQDIARNEALVKQGQAVLESQKPENKYNSIEKEEARTNKPSFQPVSGKPKKVEKSSKKSSKKS